MKKMLSIALAMLITLSIMGTGSALAANLTNKVENVSWGDQHIRVYRGNHYYAFDSNGKSRPNDYTDLTFEGNTLKVSGEYRGSNVSTVTVSVMKAFDYDNVGNQEQTIEQKASLTDGKYAMEIDVTNCITLGITELYIEYGQKGEEGYEESVLTEYFDPLYENGKWVFKYYNEKKYQSNLQMVDCQADLDLYWQIEAKNNAETMLLEGKNGYEQQVAIQAKALELCKDATTDIEKAYRVYNWISENFDYHKYTGFVDGIESPVVCQSYTRLWDWFMYYLRIPSVTISGFNVAGHAANAIYVDGKWVFLDACLESLTSGFDLTLDNMTDRVFKTAMISFEANNFKTLDAAPENSIVAKYNTITLNVTSEMIPITLATYNINGNNYVKLRDIAKLMSTTSKKFSVNWDNANQCISMQTGANYVSVGGECTWSKSRIDKNGRTYRITEDYAVPCTATVYLNGKALNLQVYTINNSNYFKLRDLGEKLNFGVGYDNNTRKITLNPYKGYNK